MCDESASQADLRALLVAMRDETPEGYYTAISWCGVIVQIIVAVSFFRPADRPPRFPSPLNAVRGLDVDAVYGLPDSDLEALTGDLWRRYADVILGGNFSYRDGAWRPFSEREIEEIVRCLAVEEGSSQS